MTNAIQIKLLIAILAVLTVIAGVVVSDHRKRNEVIRPDPVLQEKFKNYLAPPEKPYIIP
jgi:hypothetical protein